MTEVEALRRQIHDAFDATPMPARVEDMLLDGYRDSEDAYMMAAELVGKPWQDIPIERLFFHRESLGTLSAAAYRAYLPAYLVACLASDDPYDRFGADLRGYTVTTLAPFAYQNEHRRSTTAARMAQLDAAQRDAVAAVLRYLAMTWNMDDAREVLRDW